MQNIIDLAIEPTKYSTQMLEVASFFSQLKDKKQERIKEAQFHKILTQLLNHLNFVEI